MLACSLPKCQQPPLHQAEAASLGLRHASRVCSRKASTGAMSAASQGSRLVVEEPEHTQATLSQDANGPSDILTSAPVLRPILLTFTFLLSEYL